MYVFMIALLVTLLDQGSKIWIRQCMELHESIPVLPGFFHITYILNKGAAFGILENQRWVFLAIALLLFVLYRLVPKKLPKKRLGIHGSRPAAGRCPGQCPGPVSARRCYRFL